jgi:hypothetical protein
MRLGLVCLLFAAWTQTSFAQTEAAAFAPQIKAEMAALGVAVASKLQKAMRRTARASKQTTNKQTISVGAEIVI